MNSNENYGRSPSEPNEVKPGQAVAGIAIIATATVVGYSLLCRLGGFRMVKPSHHDENFFYVKTLGGGLLKCAKAALDGK